MKKKIIKRTIISILTVVIVFGLYLYLGMILTPKEFDDMGGLKFYSSTAYKYEEKNTVDVMMFGNSDLYSGISPMEIYKQSGVTSFGCGAAKQTMSAIYGQIKRTLKRQKLKVVVLETDCFYYANSKAGGSAAYEKVTFTAPFLYHTRWKELEGKDFVKRPVLKGKDNFLKGFVFSNEVKHFKIRDGFMQDVDAAPRQIGKSVLKDFDKIYKLCKKKNIPLVLFEIPSPSSWSCAKSKGIQNVVDRYNAKDKNYQIPFLDFNLGLEGFDYANHFRDKGNHCNYAGALVVTNKLNEFLQENYVLTDRRGDDRYKNWDKCLEKYEKYIEKHT